MTREEVVKIIFTIKHTYPNWMPNATEKELGEVADAWLFILEDYEAIDVLHALKGYATTTSSGFAPSVNQLIDCIHKPQETSYPTEVEAWAMVRKAINDGNYHSVERWEALPDVVKNACTPDNIREWAQAPLESIETVIASNFQRSYKARLADQKYAMRIPAAQREMIPERQAPAALPISRQIIETERSPLTEEAELLRADLLLSFSNHD